MLTIVMVMRFSALKIWFDSKIVLSLHSIFKICHVWKSIY